MKIGFLINPIAGMGGRVGLKGTDGVLEEALRRGAQPVASERAGVFVGLLKAGRERLEFLTCSGRMGAELLEGFNYSVVYSPAEETSSEDTKAACGKFVQSGADLILFCGGDGTARDVYFAVGDKFPVLGIPAGVKMHSSVFAVTPEAAGELVLDYASGDAGLREGEVMDVDEEAYRMNELRTKLFGVLRVPYKADLVQAGKMVFRSEDDDESKYSIAVFAGEFVRDGAAYIIGAGSTTAAITRQLGIEKTLLGVDVVKDGKLIAKDACEKELLNLMETEPKVKIIVSPIGAQGFVLGRGTQQISPKVIRKVGPNNIIYVATPSKLNNTPHLLVDTGDSELDRELAGYRSVVMGYRMSQRKDIKAGS